jgi:N-acyl-D-aspartate/D-glutamate deacylase
LHFTLDDWNLYDASPAWRAVTTGTHAEKFEKMQDPALRKALVDEAESADKRLRAIQAGIGGNPKGLIIQSVNGASHLEEYVGKSVGDVVLAEQKHPVEVMLDLSLAGDLHVEFLGPDKGSNVDFMAEMIESEYAIPGVSDGGAHTKFFTGGAYTTDLLTWLVRDEARVSLEAAHYRLSNLPAQAAASKTAASSKTAQPQTSWCTTWVNSRSIRRGSAASNTTCRPASGGACNGRWGIARSS